MKVESCKAGGYWEIGLCVGTDATENILFKCFYNMIFEGHVYHWLCEICNKDLIL